jgi:hypothetical protein
MKNQSPKHQNSYIELKTFHRDFFVRGLHVFPTLAGVGGWEDGWVEGWEVGWEDGWVDGREFINKVF